MLAAGAIMAATFIAIALVRRRPGPASPKMTA